jgi:hypothetical protein
MYILTALTTIFCLAVPASAKPRPNVANATTDVAVGHQLVCDEFDARCMRDPSNGGVGTAVLNSSPTSSRVYLWSKIQDTSRCNNGDVTSTCPFSDHNLDSKFIGHEIIVWKQDVTQLCLRIPADGLGVMGTCDTGNEPSTAFVTDTITSSEVRYIPVDYVNGHGLAYQTTDGQENSNVIADTTQFTDGLQYWFCSPTGC